jgi:hypothetical protein
MAKLRSDLLPVDNTHLSEALILGKQRGNGETYAIGASNN